jgi:hypothetical protein
MRTVKISNQNVVRQGNVASLDVLDHQDPREFLESWARLDFLVFRV